MNLSDFHKEMGRYFQENAEIGNKPNHHSIPKIGNDDFFRIYNYMEDKINHAGLKLKSFSSTYFTNKSGYNPSEREIQIYPQSMSNSQTLIVIIVSYLFSYYYDEDFDENDTDFHREISASATAATVYRLRELGLDLEDFGRDSIRVSFADFREYLDNYDTIEEMVSLLY